MNDSLDDFFNIMKNEESRIKTFKIKMPITAEEFAKAGFFYLSEDSVQCAFCRGIISKWKEGNSALSEHAIHFPRCPFIMEENNIGHDICGNMDVEKNIIHIEKFNNHTIIPTKSSYSVPLIENENSTSCVVCEKMKLENNIIQIEKINNHAIIPTKASPESVGFDLYSTNSEYILPFERKCLNTGLKISLPPSVYGRIAPRSGLALHYGLDVMAGVIDPDYTGEIKVLLINLSKEIYKIEKNQKIAQLICEKYISPIICETKILSTTLRGENGFGSSDK